MTANRNDTESLVTLGKIGRVHGIRGWLKILSFTDPAENLLQHQRFLVLRNGQQLELELDQYAAQGKGFIGHFKGFDNPELARELTGLELQVAGVLLPELESGDYYWHQLEGLRVLNRQGQDFGFIKRMLETGANDVMVVQGDETSIDQRERLIPYLPHTVVIEVALEAGNLIVDWEADYLI